jgi:hypothetical protein
VVSEAVGALNGACTKKKRSWLLILNGGDKHSMPLLQSSFITAS